MIIANTGVNASRFLFYRGKNLLKTKIVWGVLILSCLTLLYLMFSGISMTVPLNDNSVKGNQQFLTTDKANKRVVSTFNATRDAVTSGPITNHTLLIGISSGSKEFQRRQLIRLNQIQKFRGYDITWKFVMGRPLPMYRELIENENKTYGDLIILENSADTRDAARHDRPFDFFTYTLENLPEYKYIAKMDTDSFVNIPLFWEEVFTETMQNTNKTIITRFWETLQGKRGRTRKLDPGCVFPDGMFYALSWDLMLTINEIYDKHKGKYEAEDQEIGDFLCHYNLNANELDLTNVRSHQFKPSGLDISNEFHRIYNGSIVVHNMKTEDDYLMASTCFDSTGYNQTLYDEWNSKNWNPSK